MIFINGWLNSNRQTTAARIKAEARRLAFLYSFSDKEESLSAKLMQRHGQDLRTCCVTLVDHATFSRNYNGQVIISFIDKTYDNLAKEITYGISGIPGTNILRNIFEWR